MKDELITYETAKLAKEKGFDWPVHRVLRFDSKGELLLVQDGFLFRRTRNSVCGKRRVAQPTQSLLQRWLRENKAIDVQITSYRKHGNKVYSQEVYYGEFINISNGFVRKTARKNTIYMTFEKYEQSLEEGLQAALKLIK